MEKKRRKDGRVTRREERKDRMNIKKNERRRKGKKEE